MNYPSSEPSPRQVGYCTNVHAGATLAECQAQLERHTLAVKAAYAPNEQMGLGLWLSHDSAHALVNDEAKLLEFSAWLASQKLLPFTFNGFPFGNFHQDVVKLEVYQPTWMDGPRQFYTSDLIDLMDALLPEGQRGTISTLPLAWGGESWDESDYRVAAERLHTIVKKLEELEQKEGRWIQLCIEPEPGCLLDVSADILHFFETWVKPMGESAYRYLTVCHDVCHSAVMFEDQAAVLNAYHEAGIQVGKVQVSSALKVDFRGEPLEHRELMMEQLRGFAEPRYMHQTCIKDVEGVGVKMFNDLSEALSLFPDPREVQGEWRVHFHVPIYLNHIGVLGTTQSDIEAVVPLLREQGDCMHEEIETYAWGVLPGHLQPESLAEGIAAELDWYRDRFG